jgi:hypothetical protein
MTEMEAGINGDISWQIAQSTANNPVTPPLPWPTTPPTAEAPVVEPAPEA